MIRTFARTVLLLLPALAAAVDDPPADTSDPHDGKTGWLLPGPRVQAEMDAQMLPPGAGAIFVPAMTDPLIEPKYIVLSGKREVARARAGRTVFVQPGTYTVLVGSGATESKLEFQATVIQDRITFVPVEWCGLVVDVVNQRGTSFRGAYEIATLPKRDYVGIGIGANLREGERLTTWVLHGGNYLIISAGESYRPRKNFYTVRLIPGHLSRVTVVMDEATGDLLGAGELPKGRTVASGWEAGWVLGGSLVFGRSDDVVGKSDGMTLGFTGFSEARVSFTHPDHIGYARLDLEVGGSIRLPDDPFVTEVDDTNLEVVYQYRVTPWFGPYVRSSVRTKLLPGFLAFQERRDVVKLDENGGVLSEDAGVLDVRLAPPFGLLDLRYGLGGRFELDPLDWVSLSSRIGVGGRQAFTRDLFLEADDAATPELELRRVGGVTQFGVEASLVGQLSISRWVQLRVEADLLAPFDAFIEPVVRFRTTVAVRLAWFASLNYSLRIDEDNQLSPNTQIDQSVLVRFSFEVF